MPESPFTQLGLPEDKIQEMCRLDIRRRQKELIALGWLGRGFLAAPWLFRAFFPTLFQFDVYGDSDSASTSVELSEGVVDCTLKEASIVTRGIPLKLRLSLTNGSRQIKAAELLGIGCDLSLATSDSRSDSTGKERAKSLCSKINSDSTAKKAVVRGIVDKIFQYVSAPIDEALKEKVPLELSELQRVPTNAETENRANFTPRRDLWAREGSAEKWLQQVGGYWFAEAGVCNVRFQTPTQKETAAAEGKYAPYSATTFTFYFDPSEPVNSDETLMNINPEAIYCSFD